MNRVLASLQMWFQGWPNRRRPGVAIWLGNAISDLRYAVWSRRQ